MFAIRQILPRLSMHGLKLFGIGLVAAGLVAGPVAAAPEKALETIAVQLDQAKLLKLPAGTETIVIGNPAIADVAVQKNGVMVITGRAPGRTNFIALDSTGTIISESIVAVGASNQGKLVVYQGMNKNSYDCEPRCMPSTAIGDHSEFFTRSVEQTRVRDGLANELSSGNRKR